MLRLIQEVAMFRATDMNDCSWLLLVEPAWLTPKSRELVEARLCLSNDPEITGNVLRIYQGGLAHHSQNIEDIEFETLMAFISPLLSHFHTEGFVTKDVWKALENEVASC